MYFHLSNSIQEKEVPAKSSPKKVPSFDKSSNNEKYEHSPSKPESMKNLIVVQPHNEEQHEILHEDEHNDQ